MRGSSPSRMPGTEVRSRGSLGFKRSIWRTMVTRVDRSDRPSTCWCSLEARPISWVRHSPRSTLNRGLCVRRLVNACAQQPRSACGNHRNCSRDDEHATLPLDGACAGKRIVARTRESLARPRSTSRDEPSPSSRSSEHRAPIPLRAVTGTLLASGRPALESRTDPWIGQSRSRKAVSG